MAAGGVGRRVGGYIQNAITRYLVLALAGAVFLAAAVFALLAGFWSLNKWLQDPIASAAVLAAILASIGFLIALIAYGTTREKNATGARQTAVAASAEPDGLPTVEEVGREIEQAVRTHGPLRVLAAAAGAGIVAGMLARRLGRI